jgi:hypothetical protein
MKMAKNFIVGLYLSNILYIKILILETTSMSSFFNPYLLLKMIVYGTTKPLTSLMKLVNLHKYSINDCLGKRK